MHNTTDHRITTKTVYKIRKKIVVECTGVTSYISKNDILYSKPYYIQYKQDQGQND